MANPSTIREALTKKNNPWNQEFNGSPFTLRRTAPYTTFRKTPLFFSKMNMLCQFSATTWKVSKFGENKTTQTPDFFFLRSYVQSHVFSIVLQCFSMVTRWTIQFEIIQKLGWNQVLKKKKKWSQKRSKTRFFCGGRLFLEDFFFARPVTPG